MTALKKTFFGLLLISVAFCDEDFLALKKKVAQMQETMLQIETEQQQDKADIQRLGALASLNGKR